MGIETRRNRYKRSRLCVRDRPRITEKARGLVHPRLEGQTVVVPVAK